MDHYIGFLSRTHGYINPDVFGQLGIGKEKLHEWTGNYLTFLPKLNHREKTVLETYMRDIGSDLSKFPRAYAFVKLLDDNISNAPQSIQDYWTAKRNSNDFLVAFGGQLWEDLTNWANSFITENMITENIIVHQPEQHKEEIKQFFQNNTKTPFRSLANLRKEFQ